MKHALQLAVAALAGTFVFFSTASAQGRYVDLGRGSANPVADDGTVVAGTGFSGPCRWTEAGGHVGIASGAQYSETVRGMSADGSVITGNTWLGGVQEAGYWRPVLGGWTALDALPGSTGCGSLSSAYGLNADGFDPNRSARANCVSGDGQVVAGWDEDPDTGSRRASVWYPDSRGEILLLPPTSQNPNGAGEVYDINADGTAMVGWGVGSQGKYAFRWTAVRGVEELGLGSALATNGDASLIGGQTGQFLVLPGGSPAAAFLWTPEDAGWTLIGTGSAQLPFLGGTFLVDVTGPLLVLPATATGGVMTLDIPIPNNPLLVGASLYLQALAPDAVLPNGWAFSNGLKMTVRN